MSTNRNPQQLNAEQQAIIDTYQRLIVHEHAALQAARNQTERDFHAAKLVTLTAERREKLVQFAAQAVS